MKMYEYGINFIGIKYTWGGESAEEGYDCSGFIQELIRSNWEYSGDRTAEQLFYYLSDNFVSDQINIPRKLEEDDIVFYGKNLNTITHVGVMINTHQVLEAGGEGRNPSTKGMVRIRPVLGRGDYLCAIRLYRKK